MGIIGLALLLVLLNLIIFVGGHRGQNPAAPGGFRIGDRQFGQL